MLFFSWHANAQQRLIKGQITPKLAGCSVTLKGTAVAALTDSAGNYELSIPDSLQIDTLELVYDAGNEWKAANVNLEQNPAFNPLNSDNSFKNNIPISARLQTTISSSAPSFPFPPPAASAQDVISKRFIIGNTLGDFDKKIHKTLEALGYFEKSYYAVPNGFALVTRLERRKDNEPVPYDLPGRWDINVTAAVHSIKDYIQYLFTAPKGYFRVITFIVTDQPVKGDEAKNINRNQALAWFKTGATTLPFDIAATHMNIRYNCTVLIYEFEKSENTEAKFISTSSFQGRAHLAEFYKTFVANK